MDNRNTLIGKNGYGRYKIWDYSKIRDLGEDSENLSARLH